MSPHKLRFRQIILINILINILIITLKMIQCFGWRTASPACSCWGTLWQRCQRSQPVPQCGWLPAWVYLGPISFPIREIMVPERNLPSYAGLQRASMKRFLHVRCLLQCSTILDISIRLLHDLVEASFDLSRYLLLGDQLIPWELHPLVSYTSKVNLTLLWYLQSNLTEKTYVWSNIFYNQHLPTQVYAVRAFII